MKIEDFKEAFLKHLRLALAHQGRVMLESEELIINEFVKQAKANGFNYLQKGEIQ